MFDDSECSFEIAASFFKFAMIDLDERDAPERRAFGVFVFAGAAELKTLPIKIEGFLIFTKKGIHRTEIA